MIDPLEEQVILPRVAADCYPRDERGRKVHVSMIYRHMTVGVRGVVLESIRTPRLATSREAIARFFASLSMRPAPMEQVKHVLDHDRRIEQELDQLGL
jgi:hypothetical protein